MAASEKHPHPFTVNDLWALPRVGAPVIVPGAHAVIVGVTRYDMETNKGKEQLWLVPTSPATAPPRPLTAADVSSQAPAVSPDGKTLAFVRKPNGKDQAQVHLLPLDGGEARCVTDLPLGARELRWLPDSSALVVLGAVYREDMSLDGTRRLRDARDKQKEFPPPHVTEDRLYRFWDEWLTDGAVPHLFLVDARPGTATTAIATPRDLTPDSTRWFDFMDGGQFDVAPDGREVVFAANSSDSPHLRVRWAIFAAPIATSGPTRCLTPDDPADSIRPRYSPDGRWVIYGRKLHPDNYADRVRLARLDRKTGAIDVLTEAWDHSATAWDFADAATLVVTAEDRARSALFTFAPAGGPSKPSPLLRDGWAVGATAATADGYIYFQHHQLSRPPEVARVRLAGGALEQTTSFTADVMANVTLGAIEEVQFPGAGGDPIQMWLVYPPDFDPARPQKWPLVHAIHGGPYGVNGDLWHFRWNPHAFAAPGYVVAMVNFHGSSGFGQKFSDSITGDWGGKCAQDILLATDHVLARGFIDPARTAITGGSYGGYMVAWLATQTDRFRCGIAHAAVFNLNGMWAGDITQGWDHELGGAPWGGPEGRAAIDRWNPAAHSHGYKTPLLVVHGERDYRVPLTQGLELYGILKARGIDARLVYYADENHMVLKPRNSVHWYGEFLGWLARQLA